MTRRGLILFVSMAIIWGIPYLFIRIAVAEISPAVLVFLRTVIATAILLPIALLRVDLRAVLVHWRWVAAFAAIEIAIPWVLLGSAEQHLSSSLTGLLIASTPLIGTVFAVTTGGTDRLGRTGLAGLLVGLVGVAAIVGGDFQTNDPIALVQVFLVAACYAIGPAILARRLGGVSSLGIMALSLRGLGPAVRADRRAPVALGAAVDERASCPSSSWPRSAPPRRSSCSRPSSARSARCGRP